MTPAPPLGLVAMTVHRQLHQHGPATVRDLVVSTGLEAVDVRRAIAALGSRVAEQDGEWSVWPPPAWPPKGAAPRDHRRRKILELLADRPLGMSARAIASELGCTRSSTRAALQRAVQRRIVVATGRTRSRLYYHPRYAPPPPPSSTDGPVLPPAGPMEGGGLAGALDRAGVPAGPEGRSEAERLAWRVGYLEGLHAR